jgi:hypothetical protein
MHDILIQTQLQKNRRLHISNLQRNQVQYRRKQKPRKLANLEELRRYIGPQLHSLPTLMVELCITFQSLSF